MDMRIFRKLIPAILCFMFCVSIFIWAQTSSTQELVSDSEKIDGSAVYETVKRASLEILPVQPIEYPFPIFPKMLEVDEINKIIEKKNAQPYGVFTKEQTEEERRQFSISPLLNNDILGFYGKPHSVRMGILGRYSLQDLEPQLMDYVKQYDDVNGENRGVIPCLYLIYGTVWPEGRIGILPMSVVEEYVNYAQQRGWIVVLDHQIGRYTVEQAMDKILPLLKYPNVQLAIDPEWRTTKPMEVTGSVTGDEINIAQQMMSDYMKENKISGQRMLVIHQFKNMMIKNRNVIKCNYPGVQLIHCADGFGSPALKKVTYNQNALAKNIPLKSFKLFFKSEFPEAGFDSPIMTPLDVMNLNPRPVFVMYQ